MTCPERSPWKLFLVLTTVLAMVLSLTLTALAQRKKAKPAESKQPAELKLSDEQKQKLAAIHGQGAKERIRLNAERQIAHIELQELLQADQPNQAALDRKIDQLADLNRQLTKNQLKSLVASRSVLTQEQWAARKQKMGKRMMQHRHHRLKMFRFKDPTRGFGPGMGSGYAPARPRGGESFEMEEPLPDERGDVDEFEQLGFLVPSGVAGVEEPDFVRELHPFETDPELEMGSPPSEPADEGWQ